MSSTDIWVAMRSRLGMSGYAPELAEFARMQRDGDGQITLGGPAPMETIGLSTAEARFVKEFDGNRSLAELLANQSAEAEPLRLTDAIELIERLDAAGLHAPAPPSLWEQLDYYLAERAIARADAAGMRALTASMHRGRMDAGDQAVWRKRMPAYVERARFLREVSVLAGLGYDELARVALTSIERSFASLTDIVPMGEPADAWYIVLKGEAYRLEPDADGGPDVRAETYGPGDSFGAADMLGQADTARRIRASASGALVTLAVDPEMFGRYVAPHVPAFWDQAQLAFRRNRLASLPIFSQFDDAEVHRLASLLREDYHAEGDVIIRQGEQGDSFFLIAQGGVVIERDGEPVARLGEGEFFGESALLFTEVRTASVVVDEPTVVWRLDRDAFDAVVRERLRRDTALMPTVLNRLRAG